MASIKKKLNEVTNCKMFSLQEGIKVLGWTTEDLPEAQFKVTCNCEKSEVVGSGFFNTEVIECESCGKSMTLIFSPIRTSNSCCTVLSPSDFEIELDEEGKEKIWIVYDGSKLITREVENENVDN